jgi:hypothetical protein
LASSYNADNISYLSKREREKEETIMARNVQQIFNKVIKSGIYKDTDFEGADSEGASSRYMCLALSRAKFVGVITKEDCDKASFAIDSYLRPASFVTLRGVLSYMDLPCDFSARLAIYKDWKNRPTLKPTIE